MMNNEYYQFCHDINHMVDLNNVGVKCIEHGSFREAIPHLVNATMISTRVIGQSDAHAAHSSVMPYTSIDEIMRPATIEHYNNHSMISFSSMPSIPPPSNNKQIIGHSSYVYNKPIYLSNEMLSMGQNSLVVAAVALIFNSALAHHLFALQHQYQNEQQASCLFSKALKLYTAASTLQKRLPTNDNNNGIINNNEKNGMFVMTVMNNMGQIFELRQQPQEANKCFQRLMFVFMTIQHLECSHLHGFMEVLHSKIMPQCAFSAAAA